MAYNISKGPRDFGDLKNEEDVDTLIDWDQNKITFKTDNVDRLVVDNNHISGSGALEIVGATTVGGNLFVSGSVAMGHGLAGDGALDIKLQNGNPQIIARYSTTHKTNLLTTSNGKFRISPSGRTIEVDTTDTNGGNIHFTKNGGSTPAGGIAWNTSNEDVTLYSEADLHLGGGGLSESMFTLDSTGKVGIGIDPTHLLTVAGPISGSSLFHIVGGATFGGTVSTTGSISGSSSLQIVGTTTLGSTLAVSGGVTLAGAVSGSGLFHNVAPATFGSTLATTGSITSNGLTSTGLISGSGTFHNVGNVTMGSNLTITGNVGIGDFAGVPTEKLDINGDGIRIRVTQTPANANAAGNPGQICWDADYIYVCVSSNSWKRVAISTW